jgi:hypothetical protein
VTHSEPPRSMEADSSMRVPRSASRQTLVYSVPCAPGKEGARRGAGQQLVVGTQQVAWQGGCLQ